MRTYTVHGHDDKGNKLTEDMVVQAESDKEFEEFLRPLMTEPKMFYSVVVEDGARGLASATYFPREFSSFYDDDFDVVEGKQ